MSSLDGLGKYLRKKALEGGARIGKVADEVGKTAVGAASLGGKKAAKMVAENPKATAAVAAAGAGGYLAGKDDGDEDDMPKKKKKRSYLSED